jgi:N utilization substance protein A
VSVANGVEAEETEEAAAEEEEIPAEETYECPECGDAITVDMTSCPKCGVGLSFEGSEDSEDFQDPEDGKTEEETDQ